MKRSDVEKLWWWRKYIPDSAPGHVFFEGHETAAFYWELGRRNFAIDLYPMYTGLNHAERDIVYMEMGKIFSGWSGPIAIDQTGKRMIEYPGYAAFPTVFWNLRASKNSLLTEFEKLIDRARFDNGITKSAVNQHNSNRTKGGQPWHWIELLDEGVSPGPKKLNAAARSDKSRAAKRRDSIKNDFARIWQQIEDHRRFVVVLEKENPRAAKQEREQAEW